MNNIDVNIKTLSEDVNKKIVELSSKLAEHSLMVKHSVSYDMLYSENGNYFTGFQEEFNVCYDEFYNELKNLIYGK